MKSRILVFIRRKVYYLLNRNKYKFLSSKAYVQKLLRVDGSDRITIEKNVIIQRMTWIAAVPLTNDINCHLLIGEGSIIGHFNHIYAVGEIEIGKNVLTADKVFISDNQHEFIDTTVPILSQGIRQLSKVKIGDGSWIGENVCILGASIGKNCVIGANSVVTKDIPDYCVAVGSPARVIKKFDSVSESWISVKN
jgi:acetyltransferase-like isoleucine patch superfamily enzyme